MELSVGLHCKACDKILQDTFHDPELCSECLSVVNECIKDLSDDTKLTLEGELEWLLRDKSI